MLERQGIGYTQIRPSEQIEKAHCPDLIGAAADAFSMLLRFKLDTTIYQG
jgi:hypothetical protein